MNLSRRGLLLGGGALVVAPAIVKVTNLMPLRGVKLPLDDIVRVPTILGPETWMRKALTKYILDEQNNVVALPSAGEFGFAELPSPAMHPVNLASLMRWGEFMEGTRRMVRRTKVGDAQVSTVFLGIDHSFDDGPPVLFESCVFGGKLADEMDRYTSWAEAERGHVELVKRVRRAQGLLQLVPKDET